jgi:hypothetical protein
VQLWPTETEQFAVSVEPFDVTAIVAVWVPASEKEREQVKPDPEQAPDQL